MRVKVVTAEQLAERERQGVILHGVLAAELPAYLPRPARTKAIAAALRHPEFRDWRRALRRPDPHFPCNDFG